MNVSSLLLVRSESRKREIALRGALGASPARLMRQFITEALVLVLGGGALGLLLAYGGMHVLLKLISKDALAYVPYLAEVNLNPHVLAFAGAGMPVSSTPFRADSRFAIAVNGVARRFDRRGTWVRRSLVAAAGANLVVVELAIAVVLLVGAGLLGKSFYKLLHVEFGFQPDHLATTQVVLPETTYSKDPQVVAVSRQILSSAASLPGVKSASLTSVFPVSGNGNTDWIRIVGKPYNGEHNEVNQREVSSDYFKTLQAKLIRGQFFTEDDDASKPHVVVINRTFARQYFPDEDPIGRTMGDTELTPKSIRQIIGVVDDVKEASLDDKTWPAEYTPINQNNDTYLGLIVRTTQDEKAVLPALGVAIHKIDPGIGVNDEQTMMQRINESQTAYLHRSAAWLVGGLRRWRCCWGWWDFME